MAEIIPPLRSVRIADLPEEKKRQLWSWIKRNDPAMQQLITSPEVAAISARFSGTSIVVDIDYVKGALA